MTSREGDRYTEHIASYSYTFTEHGEGDNAVMVREVNVRSLLPLIEIEKKFRAKFTADRKGIRYVADATGRWLNGGPSMSV